MPEVSIERIQQTVSRALRHLAATELCSDKRSQNIVYPRQVAMYLSRELTDASLPKIGSEFGGRDHTTVIHATSKIARLIREDRSVYNLVQELTARIKRSGDSVDRAPRCGASAGISPFGTPQRKACRSRAVWPSSPSSTLPMYYDEGSFKT